MKKTDKIILSLLISSASVMASFISPELTLIKQFFSISTNQLSQVMTLYLAGYLSGQLIWAYVSNKVGRLASIKYGMVTSIFGAVFMIAALQTESFNLFLLGRAFTAFGLASGLVCGFTIVTENLQDDERKQYLSIIAVVFTASIYLSILLSGYLVKYTSLEFIIRSVFLYTTVTFFLCFYLKTNLLPPRMVEKPRYPMYLKFHPKVIVFSLALSITTIISYSYALYAPILTKELFFFSPTDFGIFSLVNMIFILLGGVLYLKLVQRFLDRTIVLFGLFIIIASCVFSLLRVRYEVTLSVFDFFILCSLLNIASGLIYPAATYNALKYGDCKATSSAIMNVIKLTMPIVALRTSAYIYAKELTVLILTIVLFSLAYFSVLWFESILSTRLYRNKMTQ